MGRGILNSADSLRVQFPAVVILVKQRKLSLYGASVSLSLEQAPLTCVIVGSILATDSREKSQSTLYRKSCVSSHREC